MGGWVGGWGGGADSGRESKRSVCFGCQETTLHLHLLLYRGGRWGTRDVFYSSFLHFPLFSTAVWDLTNSRPVHFLMLSSHLFFCLPCLLPPFTVPCWMVLTRPDQPPQFAFLYDGHEVFVLSDCLLDLGTDFIVANMVFV